MKASEILDQYLTDMGDLNDSQYHYVKLAMDEYAKEQSIEFLRYADNLGYTRLNSGMWGNLHNSPKSSDELYEIFQQSKSINV